MMGRPLISRSGFGRRSVRGRSRVPKPAARIKAVLNRRLFNVIPHLQVSMLHSTPSHYSKALRLFLSELRINLYQRRHNEPWDRRNHDPKEVVLIAKLLLEPTAEHGRKHHSQGHDPRRDGVVDRFVLPLRYHDHEHGIGRKAKAVTKLFYGDSDIDQMEIANHRLREIDIDEIRQMHSADHDPDPGLEPLS